MKIGISFVFNGLGWYKVKMDEIFLMLDGFKFCIICFMFWDFN